MKLPIPMLAALLALAGPAAAAEDPRWYSAAQVERGATLFRENCAVCHGANGEATPNWKQTDADGNYPPPPLNGTAHTWHHDLDLLRRTIREGGARLGGLMPGFADKLDAGQIDSIIAFFQSQWPEDIYRRWAGRFQVGASQPPSPPPSLEDVVQAANDSLTRRLRERLGISSIDDVQRTPVEGLWQVKMGNQYVYLLDGGKFVLTGDLINLEQGRNLTEQSRRVDVVDVVAGFDDADLAIFPANGEEKASLAIFTDTSCPYCQQLHSEIEQLQDAGISVRYIPFPRGGSTGPGYATLKSVWCAEDRLQAMTDAKNNFVDDLPPGDCAAAAVVDRGFEAGRQIAIRGTPALILSNGQRIEGYVPHEQLVPQLLGQSR